MGVNPRGLDVESVAIVASGDHERVAEGSAQPGRLRLQGVAPGLHRSPPQLVDEAIGAHKQTVLKGESQQELRGLAAVDHPDNVLVAWIAGESRRSDATPTNEELT
jgi:hypothetical protein